MVYACTYADNQSKEDSKGLGRKLLHSGNVVDCNTFGMYYLKPVFQVM